MALRTPFEDQVIFEIGVFENIARSFVGSSKKLIQIVIVLVSTQ